MDGTAQNTKSNLFSNRTILYDGYKMPTGNKGIEARYCPAINQVWINGLLPQKKHKLVLAHEFIHMYMASMQPSRLLILDTVLNVPDIRWVNHFEDIVETTAELYYQIRTFAPDINKIKEYAKQASYAPMYSELFKLWMDIIDRAHPNIQRSVVMEEGIRGLCVLLMHVIPHSPQTGPQILHAMRKISLPEKWHRSQDVWGVLYRRLDEKISKTEDLRNNFTLAVPIGVHRYIADTVFFIAAAIKKVVLDPMIITAVFPTLLELITQESFILLPIINTIKFRNKYFSGIKIIHTTYRTPRISDNLATRQEVEANELTQKGVFCCASDMFVQLVRKSKEYRISNLPDRTHKCFQAELELLSKLLKKYIDKKPTCPGCSALYNEEKFRNACEVIINITSKTRQTVINAIKRYEQYLQTDTMISIKEESKLSKAPEAICKYKFL